MITLRPHQERIIKRLSFYNKGQVIVPTGGGKTLTMIMDAKSSMDRCNSGVTTVVVAPKYSVKSNCVLSLWRSLILTTVTHICM